jgi:hypothetical protein
MTCPNISPYSISTPISSANIINLNYTNQDFWSMKTRLVQFINERFENDFTDFVESSLAIMLIENFAFIADTLSFKIDQIANEIFIDTVTELDNAFRLSKLVGFEPLPPISSRALWTASITTTLNQDLVIPTPFLVKIGSPEGSINFELFPADAMGNVIFDEDIIIPAGKNIIQNIIGLQGQTLNASSISLGDVSQYINIPVADIAFDSIRVWVNGSLWERVDYFTASQPKKEYRVEFNSDYSAVIIFGNNRAGLIPSQGSEIIIEYRVGGGVQGNIVAANVYQEPIMIHTFPYAIPVTFRNYTRGEYGYDGDGIEDIRRKLPEYLRTQNRAVTGLDYKTLADQFASPYHGQTGKAVASLRHYGCAANIVDLYVLTRDDKDNLMESSDAFKADLQYYLDQRKMLTDVVCIRDGNILETDVDIDVIVNRSQRKFEEEIRSRINLRLNNFFSLVNWEYGQNLKNTDIIKVLSDIREITNFEIHFTTDDLNNSGQIVTTKFYEIIRLANLTVNFTYE